MSNPQMTVIEGDVPWVKTPRPSREKSPVNISLRGWQCCALLWKTSAEAVWLDANARTASAAALKLRTILFLLVLNLGHGTAVALIPNVLTNEKSATFVVNAAGTRQWRCTAVAVIGLPELIGLTMWMVPSPL